MAPACPLLLFERTIGRLNSNEDYKIKTTDYDHQPPAELQKSLFPGIYCCCCPLAGQPSQTSWKMHIIDNSSFGADGTKACDANADGREDFICGWEQGNVARLYLNPANDKRWPFIEVPAPDVEDALVVDIDGDGQQDIITFSEGTHRRIAFHWAPKDDWYAESGRWHSEDVPCTVGKTQWMFGQPMNVDNKHGIDIIVAAKNDGAMVGWLESPPDPRDLSEWKLHRIADASWIMSVEILDIDRDGRKDILVTDRHGDTNGVKWYKSPEYGSPKLSQPWQEELIGMKGQDPMFLDARQSGEDGLWELWVPNLRDSLYHFVQVNASGRAWTSESIPFPEASGLIGKSAAMGDVNNDGRQDLITTYDDAEGRAGVMWSTFDPGTQQWLHHNVSGDGGNKFDFAYLTDMDGDGDLDVLSSEENNNSSTVPGLGVIWYENPATSSTVSDKVIQLKEQAPPPEWALLERHLLAALYPAALEYVNKYTNQDGTLIWRDEWPGMDGSDDGYESFYNFPLYCALGGPMAIDSLARHLWEGVTRQFTGYGQVYNEFDAGYDWMHHGESYTYLYFFGLTDPENQTFRNRSLKFASMYMDPKYGNYDPELKLIRSPLTGSKGPRFVNTAEDWVTHRPILANYLLPYEDIPGIDSSAAWNDDDRFPLILQAMNERMMKGDVPLNLAATSLIANAYMYTGEVKYKKWIEEYTQAWIRRVEQNDGFLPDNVGLSNKVGEHTGGKRWGGYYGWRWPHGLPNQMEATVIGAGNAYLVSGDDGYLSLPKAVIKLVEEQKKEVDGKILVPYRFDDRGWWDFRPMRPKYPTHLWYISRQQEDWERAKRLTDPGKWHNTQYRKGKGDSENTAPWMGFLEGKNPDYPVEILRANYKEVQRRLQMVREDESKPDEQDVHHFFQRNPVILEGLVHLMLGAPNHIYHGGLLHTSLRYFDPENNRSGIPPDVAALVSRISSKSVTVQLVNLHPSKKRQVIIQGGMFAEHQIERVRQVIHYPYQFYTIEKPYFQVELGPGACGQLEIDLNRFQNQPSYRFPWHISR